MSQPENRPPEGILPGPAGEKMRYEIAVGPPGPKGVRPGAPAFAKPPEQPTKPRGKSHIGDSGTRETIETVVFVVVLVLLLKTFLAEAFVIPTGSMATTLLGYHVETTCEKCGYKYVFNASSVAEPAPGRGDRIFGSWCHNCQAYNSLQSDGQGGGNAP